MAQPRDPSARPPRGLHRVQPRESIIDPDALAGQLRNLPQRPSVDLYLAEANDMRDELVSLAGRPTRDLISIPPDPINPAWDSREAIDMAREEGSHWTTELGIWIRFLRWRKWNFDRRVEAAPESSEPPLPDPHDVDAYALHLEFRNYLLDTVAIPEKYVLASWRNSRERLDTLEPQLAEMRAERGLPADDNPPPPALIALWADEAAKKAAEVAAQPQCIQPANRKSALGESPSPPPPRKRKREGAEDHSDEAAARAPAAMEQPIEQPPPAKRRSTRAAPAVVGQRTEQPPANRRSTKAAAAVAKQPIESPPARRQTLKGGPATVVDPPAARPPPKRRAAKPAVPAVAEVPPRRSRRIAALPRKNYKG